MVGDLNASLSYLDGSFKLQTNTETSEVYYTKYQMDLIINRILHLTGTEHIYFSVVHENSLK